MNNIECLVHLIVITLVILLLVTTIEDQYDKYFNKYDNKYDEYFNKYIDKYSSVTQIDSTIDLLHVENLLTSDESDYLINLSKGHFINSQVISTDGISELSDTRTSQSYIVNEFDPIVNKIKNKINIFLSENIDNLKNWSDYIENTQMVKYDIGQQYKSHHDYFTQDYLKKDSNQRNYTIFIYLNNVEDGGETYFPKLDKKIKPKKGSALFWRNCVDANICFDESLHQGLPPLKGEKYGMNVWIRFNKIR